MDHDTTRLTEITPPFPQQSPPHPPGEPKRRGLSGLKLFVLVLFFMAVSSLGTLAALSVFGLHTELVTILPRGEAENYAEFRQNYSELLQLKDFIGENYYIPPDEDSLKIGIYKGLFQGLGDPYSEYMTADELEDVMIAASGQYDGIGVSIVPDEKGYINVVAPIQDTPAEKIGIRAGDKIIRIDDIEYTGESIDKAVSVMRGKPGTKVKITVLRGTDVLDFLVTRASVTMQSVKYEMLKDSIGYIRITSFERATPNDFKSALTELEKKNAAGLVIDLRGNPGGLVEESVAIADMLIDQGLIVYMESQSGERKDYKAKAGRTNLPYVVLVDNGSASASEILAAAIKDSESGLLIGTTTYGKGIVQQLYPLNNGDGIKLTISQYFSPNGSVIHKEGVEPNITVELQESDLVDGFLPRENDRQLEAAIKELRR